MSEISNSSSCGCIYCDKYLSYINDLQNILEDNHISYSELKIRRKNNVLPDLIDILDLSENNLETIIDEYYTEELFQKGIKGIVEFIHEYIVQEENKLLYVCADPVKKIFHYYDVEGLQKDIRCKMLLDSLHNPFIKRVNKIYKIIINRIYQEDEIKIDSDDDEYDSDVEEIIANEVVENNNQDSIDDRINQTVATFLEIKNCIGKNRKPLVDELVTLLSI